MPSPDLLALTAERDLFRTQCGVLAFVVASCGLVTVDGGGARWMDASGAWHAADSLLDAADAMRHDYVIAHERVGALTLQTLHWQAAAEALPTEAPAVEEPVEEPVAVAA